MHVKVLKYGPFVEVTEVQKLPHPPQVRVHRRKNKNRPIGPRRPDNIKRTKRICLRRVSAALEAFGCPLLCTLTFAGDSSDAAFANRSLSEFQVRLRTKFPLAESIFIPELSPRYRIHFHGFLFNVPLHYGDIRKGRRTIQKGTERETRELAKLWRYGFVDAVQTNGSPRLAHYISKYVVKGGHQLIFNAMRMIRCSQGLPRETVWRHEEAEEMARKYATENTPIFVWEGDNQFVGGITKKTYQLYESNPLLPKV